ncbi:ABC transporter permease [Niveispirillum cyanobacteriorum]|uniref:ABC transporter permease n=1 Tax=Niveispirillum cyanobacteriorum TaxID=1612173 RepID=A0A2K9NHQ7_9PROT|nr:ABC transporter permease [Niveispirillum cyanobacteriorum]AUN32622.1 ABC transporter permease [Niveispirillum cyanobacteriorum]GGE76565.1 ABC transporter permease [Niveispirillum cyanobacteriorum]
MRSTLQQRLLPLLVPGLILAAWLAATSGDDFTAQVLVPPVAVLDSFNELLASGELADHLRASLSRLLLGFGIGSGLGLGFGILLARSALVNDFAGPFFQAVRQVPSIAFLPMLILLLGVDEGFKLAIVAKAAFFPVALATHDAVKGISKGWLEVAAIYRLSPIRVLFRLILPATVPPVLTGLRLGLTRAWIVLVAAELMAAENGIGQMMEMGRQMFRIDTVMVGVALTGLIGFALDQGVRLAERRLVRWKAV